jgi:hypothetical protein
MKRLTALGIAIGLALMVPATAQADTNNDLTTNGSPLCFKWHMEEFRSGVIVSGLLWRIDQTVTWCNDGAGHFNGTPKRVSYTHSEGVTWAFGGWDEHSITHKTNPSRYVYRIAATENGLTPIFINEHNYPYVRMTVYPGAGQAAWAASCGC